MWGSYPPEAPPAFTHRAVAGVRDVFHTGGAGLAELQPGRGFTAKLHTQQVLLQICFQAFTPVAHSA